MAGLTQASLLCSTVFYPQIDTFAGPKPIDTPACKINEPTPDEVVHFCFQVRMPQSGISIVNPEYLAFKSQFMEQSQYVSCFGELNESDWAMLYQLQREIKSMLSKNKELIPQLNTAIRAQQANSLSQDQMLALILAVIYVESRNKSGARSDHGAVGLMQIKTNTALDILIKMGPEEIKAIGIDPKDPLVKHLNAIKELDKRARSCKTGETAKFNAIKSALKREFKIAKGILGPKLTKDKLNIYFGIKYLALLLDKYSKYGLEGKVDVNVLYLAMTAYSTGTYFVDRLLEEGRPVESFACIANGYPQKVIAAFIMTAFCLNNDSKLATE